MISKESHEFWLASRKNPQFGSPDLIVFFFGLLITAALHARRVRGAIILGILAATAIAACPSCVLPGKPLAR